MTADVLPTLRLDEAAVESTGTEYVVGAAEQRPRLAGIAEVHWDPTLPTRTSSGVHMFLAMRSGGHPPRTCEAPTWRAHDEEPRRGRRGDPAMGARWPDEHIAATLNRMGSKTPLGHTWSAKRVGDYRRTKGVAGYESAIKDGRCLTMVEAAEKAEKAASAPTRSVS